MVNRYPNCLRPVESNSVLSLSKFSRPLILGIPDPAIKIQTQQTTKNGRSFVKSCPRRGGIAIVYLPLGGHPCNTLYIVGNRRWNCKLYSILKYLLSLHLINLFLLYDMNVSIDPKTSYSISFKTLLLFQGPLRAPDTVLFFLNIYIINDL